MRNKQKNHLSRNLILKSAKEAFLMLTPQAQFRNPVMFVTYIGALVTILYTIKEFAFSHGSWFHFQISLWLIFTVFFANIAQTIAESRGKAQTASLKKNKIDAFARQEVNGVAVKIPAGRLKRNDIIFCEAGDVIPADGDVIEGVATVDESAITGESAPVIRESGGDRSAVTAGTKVLSDRLKICVTSEQGHNFLDRMINLIEGAKRQKTPNEIALNILLSATTIIFILVVMTLKAFGDFSEGTSRHQLAEGLTIPILISFFVCLTTTCINALLSAVGIAGIDRLIRKNVIAFSGHSVETAGDIDILILDKTGTITIGNRVAFAFLPIPQISSKELARIAQLASLADETPEGRSIVVLAKTSYDLRAETFDNLNTVFIPFSAQTRMSGIDFKDIHGNVIRRIRKGSADAIRKHAESLGENFDPQIISAVESIAKKGDTPLIVSDNGLIMGIIHLKDVIKGGIQDRFAEMRKMGIKTIMVTGDNPLTAAAIAAEAGVDEYIAEATPEMKLAKIRQEQAVGRLVAMTGDGTNDAPALAQADVGVAMNTGTQASREAGNMIDLDSNPTKLIDIVKIGKQMLMTRGALTTFSIANDIAKYFALIPALFGALYATGADGKGPLQILNIMELNSPHSAILSAVIVNALTILALAPIALRGVKYKPQPAHILLKKNLSVYGIGGIIAPFIGIKLVDMIISFMGLV